MTVGEDILKRLASVAVISIGILLPQYALAACGYAGVSVSGTTEEVADACRALDEVLAYFGKIGFQSEPEISISFRDRVYVDMYPQVYGSERKQPAGRSEVSGLYDSRRKELQIASARSEVKRERRPWGIEWGPSIAYSILQHELTHAILAGRPGIEYHKLGKSWHEFIAYAVQFDLMDRELKRAVLANYPEAQPFTFPENVNAIVYGADPDAFAVSAHLYAEANGGSKFIRQILAGEAPFGTREFEFFWVK
jgi:hypothetical protein